VNHPASSSPELDLARRYDAEGRHHEAINELARGTRGGNLACMRELGKRLLTGDRAPLLAPDGARFIAEAADSGDAEAAARVSALAALGLHRRQDWREALAWLVIAAQRGWQPARDQLVALNPSGATLAPSGAALESRSAALESSGTALQSSGAGTDWQAL